MGNVARAPERLKGQSEEDWRTKFRGSRARGTKFRGPKGEKDEMVKIKKAVHNWCIDARQCKTMAMITKGMMTVCDYSNDS